MSSSTSAAFSSSPGSKPVHPLQIPEVLLQVGAFLNISDLRSCLRVCVAFRHTLAPLIWSTPQLKDDQDRLVPRESVQANAHLVENFPLICEPDGRYLSTYATMRFPNLKKLVIVGSPAMGVSHWRSAMSGPLPRFIQRHRETVQLLQLSNLNSGVDTFKFWTSLSKAPCLSELLIDHSVIAGDQSLRAFWEFVAQDSLRRIFFLSITFRGRVPIEAHANKPFRLQRAVIADLNIEDDMFMALMNYFGCSSELRSLVWEAVYQAQYSAVMKVFLIQTLTKIIQRGRHRFGGLREWRLNGPGSMDPVLADFLNLLPHGLSDVHLRRTEFGPMAFQALMGHHALTLTNLDLTQCQNSKCAMIQQILCVCPGLISIKGRGLHASDVMRTKECPWICDRLEEWVLSIYMDTKDPYDKEAHQEIFGRLSRLIRLKTLNLMGDTEGPDGGESILERSPYPTISMQLGLGLGEIRKLRGMTHLMFHGEDEKVSIEDIRFLYSAFPMAEDIGCSLHERLMFHPDLSKIIQERKKKHGGSAFAA
ncbi:hypothetical protein EMPS_02777 [Entomortierella parvispora]|uniref:F-box domain-containing protein n=1 Tax=Entomortierella parvispora TaxID=205924 RepID=A0A9P3H5I1_9FUNG|nr:hypothetical protein EMPS_02777 [Entomortierella parvispora]